MRKTTKVSRELAVNVVYDLMDAGMRPRQIAMGSGISHAAISRWLNAPAKNIQDHGVRRVTYEKLLALRERCLGKIEE